MNYDKKDSFPLIPKNNQQENHDVSHLIREIFQDTLGTPEFATNVVENTQKYSLTNQNLKVNAENVLAAYNNAKLSMEDIGFVEDDLMVEQGKLLINQDIIQKDQILKEHVKLKQKGMLVQLNLKDNAQKYGLIQKSNLLPTTPERTMDFRLNANPHRCLPCESEFDVSSTARKRKQRPSKKYAQREEPPKIIFEAEPNKVLFEEYQTGVIYKKHFKLRNISKTTQAFILRPRSKSSFFKVELVAGYTRVAAGMYAVFSVKYQTDVYKDVEEIIIFYTYSGRDVEVKLRSCRRPPLLIAYVIKSIAHFANNCPLVDGVDLCDNVRCIALNTTIDCGSCLVGQELNITLMLKNPGNAGKFFILSEDSWFSSDISAVNANMKLTLGPFKIYPAYFKIDKDGFMRINITFVPLDFGLAVEKVFFLCDNNTMEELEMVADGILFQRNSITIEIEPSSQDANLLKSQSRYFLLFGRCIRNQKLTRIITVHNNTTLGLLYKWVISETTSHTDKNVDMKKMNPSWISLASVSQVLPSESTTDFALTLECKTKDPGHYALTLSLYILNIPEVSLAENKFDVLNEPSHLNQHQCESLEVLIGEIEISCHVVPVSIIFDPAFITIPYTVTSTNVFEQVIQLYSFVPITVNCKWILPEYIQITPDAFLLKPKTTFLCEMVIKILTEEDFEENLIFSVNEGLHEITYKISAILTKPDARFTTSLLDFGRIPQAKKIPGKMFGVQNTGTKTVWFEIIEFSYCFENNTIYELDASKHLSLTGGILHQNEAYKIKYTIDNNVPHHRWFSFLILVSSYPVVETMNSLCLITYQALKPTVVIHTKSSTRPILYPGKLLYVDCTTYYRLCLHNTSKVLPNKFVWHKPIGSHAKNIKINFSPKRGIIPPQKCVHITVSLAPNTTGVLDDIFVPCFVGYVHNPLILSVLCVVGDICVYFHLPNNNERFDKIFWPPNTIEDFEELILTEEITPQLDGEDDVEKRPQICGTLDSLQSETEQPIEHTADLLHFTSADKEIHLEESLSLMHEASIVSEQSEISESTLSLVVPTISLQDSFNSNFNFQEHVIECHNVPLKTPVKKTIVIENLTPIVGKFDLELVNFCEMKINTKDINPLDDILAKLKMKKKDEWECIVNSKYGIVVKTVPGNGTVVSYSSVEIDIWIYANTWGTYIEEILIKINDVIPFCFNLLIQVVGIPIEFPIALNSIKDETIIRFGNLPYLSKPLERKLKVTNFSSVPVCLVWHVFIPCKMSERQPFNILVDTFEVPGDKSDIDITNMLLTPKYYGKEDLKIFEIRPRAVNINSKSTETISITMNPQYFEVQFAKTEFKAHLIGHLHLADAFATQSNVYSRQTAAHLPPAKVKLLATLEMPLLKFELVKGDTRIGAYANNIIDAQEVRFERLLVFRNINTAPATVYMHISSPFQVISVQTSRKDTNKNVKGAVVQPGECVEVLVECIIDAEQVLQYSDMLFNERTTTFTEGVNFRDNSIIILRHLNIHQCGLEKQLMSMELLLFYPKLYASHEVIDFGIVFIGNTKKMLLTLTNASGAHLPYNVHKLTTSDVMVITPNNGVIPKACGVTHSTVTLSLYFMPSECKPYQEAIRILTNIPFCCSNVTLTGIGVSNEKYYLEGT